MTKYEKDTIVAQMRSKILEEMNKEIKRKELFLTKEEREENNGEEKFPVLNIISRFFYKSNGGSMRFLRIEVDNNNPHLRVVEHISKKGFRTESYYIFWNVGRYSLVSIETRTPDYWRQAFTKYLFVAFDLEKIPVVYDDRGLFYIIVRNDYIDEFIDIINEAKEIYFYGRKRDISRENRYTLKIDLLNI